MKLSLAGWSLQTLFKGGKLSLLDFPSFTKENFGIEAVELNSPFFASKEPQYLKQLVDAAQNAGVEMLNIAVDEQGDLSATDEAVRAEGLKAYSQWIPVAKAIGVRAIRANSGGKEITDRPASIAACIRSFTELAQKGKEQGVAVLMENHGGLSCDPDSIIQVMEAVAKKVGKEWIGTLPDFGNWYPPIERYEATKKIFPYAKAVHAKTKDIDENLNHPAFDLAKCVRIAKEAGYDGWLGIEYEGSGEPIEGVKRSVRILRPLL
jgi:sugar phosphate isomerase/epimerase